MTTAISSTNRSKVSNGTSLHLAKVDGRQPEARRWRDIYRALVEAIGGEGKISEPQRMAVRRVASMAVAGELMDASIANGVLVDMDVYLRLSGTIGRILRSLDLVDGVDDEEDQPSLQDFLDRRAAG